ALEHSFEAEHDRAFDTHHEVAPVQSAANIRSLVVVRVDEVLGPHETDTAVDDDEFAVVAQVRALILPAPRPHGKHLIPFGAEVGETLGRALGSGIADRRYVVEEYAHSDSAGYGFAHRLEHAVGRGIVDENVELDVNVLAGLTDGFGHLCEGALVV